MDPAGSRCCAQTQDWVVPLIIQGVFYPVSNQPPLPHTHTHKPSYGPAVKLAFHLCVLMETNRDPTRRWECEPSWKQNNWWNRSRTQASESVVKDWVSSLKVGVFTAS